MRSASNGGRLTRGTRESHPSERQVYISYPTSTQLRPLGAVRPGSRRGRSIDARTSRAVAASGPQMQPNASASSRSRLGDAIAQTVRLPRLSERGPDAQRAPPLPVP